MFIVVIETVLLFNAMQVSKITLVCNIESVFKFFIDIQGYYWGISIKNPNTTLSNVEIVL